MVYSPKMALNGKIAEAGISEKGAFAASAPVQGPLGSPGSCGVTADGLTPSSVKGRVLFPAECVFRPGRRRIWVVTRSLPSHSFGTEGPLFDEYAAPRGGSQEAEDEKQAGGDPGQISGGH